MDKHAARIALVALVALVLGSGVGLAQTDTPATPEACTLVGTWMVKVPSGGDLVAVFTRGGLKSSSGQLDAEWIVWEPTLASRFPAVRTTDPKGVWADVTPTTFNATWVAYGIGVNGPLYVLRARALATLDGCDQASISTTLDLFLPSHDIWRDTPLMSIGPEPWIARRMPIVPLAPVEPARR
jgi:hypothetical protein